MILNLKYFILSIPVVMTTGFLLDILFGDPNWFPHPVKAIAFFSNTIKKRLNGMVNKRIAGNMLAFIIILGTFIISSSLTYIIGIFFNLVIAWVFSVFISYTSIAIKDLRVHAFRVYEALKEKDILKARKRLSMIVGRDTDRLSEKEIIKATIESISENSVDGIFSPIFFGFLLGPPGALTFKAISTLDSMFGYNCGQFKQFGRASAKTDDIVNFVPARLSILIFVFTGFIYNRSLKRTWRTILRDRFKHPSPNSAIGEAAVAGILGVRLGGPCNYGGKLHKRLEIGEEIDKICIDHIRKAIKVVYLFSFISLLFLLLLYLPVALYIIGII